MTPERIAEIRKSWDIGPDFDPSNSTGDVCQYYELCDEVERLWSENALMRRLLQESEEHVEFVAINNELSTACACRAKETLDEIHSVLAAKAQGVTP